MSPSALDQSGCISVGNNAIGSVLTVGNGNTISIVYASDHALRPPPANANPYRGLSAFDETSQGNFFGRERLTRSLLQRMEELVNPQTARGRPRLLTVLGPSGSGKSSLVRAGLVPAIALSDASALWCSDVAVLRPGADPVAMLAGSLARLVTGLEQPLEKQRDFEKLIRAHAASGPPNGLSIIAAGRPACRGMLIVLVDQFEEAYALAGSGADLDTFVATLLQAASAPGGRVFLLLTLRSDFYGALARHPDMSQAVAENEILIPAMSPEELHDAIAKPAKAAGRPIDFATIDRILEQATGEASTLPLVQFAMERIWEGLVAGAEPAQTLSRLNGVAGALAQTAQGVYDGLAPAHQKLARRAFVSAIHVDEATGRVSRRRAWLDEVIPAGGVDIAEAQHQLHPFVESRLLVMGSSAAGRPFLELPHEALIRHWEALKSWVDSLGETLRLGQRASDDAERWKSAGRPKGQLWRPPDLERLGALQLDKEWKLTELQTEFYRAAVRERNLARLLLWGGATAACVGIVLFVAVVSIEKARHASELLDKQQRFTRTLQAGQSEFLASQSRQRSDKGDGMTGLLLALEALPSDLAAPDRPYVRDAALALFTALVENREQALLQHPRLAPANEAAGPAAVQRVTAVAFSPDNSRVMTGAVDGHLRVWDASNGALARELPGQSTNLLVAFAPRDSTLAAGVTDDNVVRLWDTGSGIARFVGRGHTAQIRCLSFAEDGTMLVTGSVDETARLWDLQKQGRDQVFRAAGGAVLAASIARDPDRVLTLSEDGHARLWDAHSGQLGRDLAEGGTQRILAAQFSRKGNEVLTVWTDGSIAAFGARLDASLGARRPLMAGRGVARRARISPDGSRIAIFYQDDSFQIFAPDTGTALGPLLHEDNGQIGMDLFSGDSRFLATVPASDALADADQPRPVRVWSADSGSLVATLLGHDRAVDAVALDGEGTRLVTGSADGTARLWDARASRSETVLTGYGGAAAPLQSELRQRLLALGSPGAPAALSGNGERLALASGVGNIALWDVRSRRLLQTLPGHQAAVTALAFSPSDSGLLASGGSDGSVNLWHSEEDRPTALDGHKAAISAIAFAGPLMLTASWDGTVRLWHLPSGRMTFELQGNAGATLAAAISSDGAFVATGSEDHTIRLWSTGDGSLLQTLQGHEQQVVAVDFSPDGTRLVSGSSDGSARLWRLGKGQPPAAPDPPLILAHDGLVLSARFSADGKYVLTTCQDGAAHLWDATTGRQVSTVRHENGAGVTAASFAADGSLLATGSEDGLLELHDVMSGERLAGLRGHQGRVTAAIPDPSGRLVVTASDDGSVRIWRIPPVGQGLLELARRTATHALSDEQRHAFFLVPGGESAQ